MANDGSERSSGFDVTPGDLGDPWLLAAVSALTLTPKFLERVVPPDQSFDSPQYCGLFRYFDELHEMNQAKRFRIRKVIALR